jgi:hypothetical protein
MYISITSAHVYNLMIHNSNLYSLRKIDESIVLGDDLKPQSVHTCGEEYTVCIMRLIVIGSRYMKQSKEKHGKRTHEILSMPPSIPADDERC